MIEPLSLNDDYRIPSITNFSRSVSFSIVDENGNNIRIKTDLLNPIKIIIPRDPNLIIPKMFLQNVTQKNILFNYHKIDLQELNFSSYLIHFEFNSLDKNLSYLLIYQFDSLPELTNSVSNIQNWTLFCSVNKNQIFDYPVNIDQNDDYHSIIFGIRQLTLSENQLFCFNKTLNPPINDRIIGFSADYQIRSYLSTCFFLDENNKWNSDGLRVSLIHI